MGLLVTLDKDGNCVGRNLNKKAQKQPFRKCEAKKKKKEIKKI